MTTIIIEPDEQILTGWCDSCQQEFIGVCGHYEESRKAAQESGAEEREPVNTF